MRINATTSRDFEKFLRFVESQEAQGKGKGNIYIYIYKIPIV